MRRKLLIISLAAVLIGAGVVCADRLFFGFSGPLASVQRTLARAPATAAVGFDVVGRDFNEVTDIQFVPGSVKSAIVLLKSGSAHHVSFDPEHAVTRAHSPEVLRVAVHVDQRGLGG